MAKRRGAGQRPSDTKYSLGEWIKGYAAWLLVFPLYCALWLFARVFKRLPAWLHRKLLRGWWDVVTSRRADVMIPAFPPVYMRRWWRIPRNAFFNVYYHLIHISDEDAALHDHPWWSFSIVLEGGYYEHTIAEGGVSTRTWYPAGSVRFRPNGKFAHRLELERDVDGQEMQVKTIFITGPTLRRWGFHHTLKWVDAYEWDDFCKANGVKANRMKGYAEQVSKRTD